jgi:hypothetical protein
VRHDESRRTNKASTGRINSFYRAHYSAPAIDAMPNRIYEKNEENTWQKNSYRSYQTSKKLLTSSFLAKKQN